VRCGEWTETRIIGPIANAITKAVVETARETLVIGQA
jgi:hypothetical protein